jgi:hypothetical protein
MHAPHSGILRGLSLSLKFFLDLFPRVWFCLPDGAVWVWSCDHLVAGFFLGMLVNPEANDKADGPTPVPD